MSGLTANSLGRDYTLGDVTAEEKGLRELVELYGERFADADWRYQEFRCKHPVRQDPGACRTLPLMPLTGLDPLFGGVIGFVQVEVLVGHGQGGFAEHFAAEVLAVGDDAAAQVDEVAAQGQVAVHVDVGAVHGQRGVVLGHDRRWATAQQALGAGAGGEVGTAAHRGGAPGGRVGGPPRRCAGRPRRRIC